MFNRGVKHVMEFHQLKTFVAVAREGSITRASERLHLSQPAVSAHIKSIEDRYDLSLFERTSRGMTLTGDGLRLLAKAEKALEAHGEFLSEASRLRGTLTGRIRIGVGSNACNPLIETLLIRLADSYPDVEIRTQHASGRETVAALRGGAIDACFFNSVDDPEPDISALPVDQFSIFLAAAPGTVPRTQPLDWEHVADLPWIYPQCSSCCGRATDNLFLRHRFRPKRVISVDREGITRSLIVGGVGIGVLHADTAREAEARGEVELLHEISQPVRVFFAHLASRDNDPILALLRGLL